MRREIACPGAKRQPLKRLSSARKRTAKMPNHDQNLPQIPPTEPEASAKQTERRITAAFYRERDGRVPFRQWLDQLDENIRRCVVEDIATLELIWPNHARAERHGEGLFSLVSDPGDGTGGVLSYFLIDGTTMLLLHGGDHGQLGLATAIGCMEDHLSRRRDN